jgi:hypothetical protein
MTQLDVPVSFGNVSIGENTAGISVKIDRKSLNPVAADELLCGRRVEAKIAAGTTEADPDQPLLFDDLDYQLAASFEVKGYSVRPKYIRATLNVILADIDVEVLGHFAKRQGRLVVFEVGELEEPVAEPAAA